MARFRWDIFGTGAVSAKFVAGLAVARSAWTRAIREGRSQPMPADIQIHLNELTC